MFVRFTQVTITILLLFVLPGVVWFESIGNLLTDFRPSSMPGQNLYLFSKLMGLYVIIFLWLQVTYGLTRNDRLLGLPLWTKKRHQYLGITTFVMIVLHVSFFVLAVSIRKNTFAVGLLFPNFDGFYHTMLSVGWFALVMVIAVISARVMREKLNFNWIWMHRLSLPALFLGLTHGLMIGSEATMGALFYLYISLGVITALLLFKRFVNFVSSKTVRICNNNG